MSNTDKLVLYFVPSLVATLLNREKAAGRPLTETEVLSIRDGCPCIALRPDTAQVAAESRGYDDIDPEHCWEAWQAVRNELHKAKPPA